MIEALDSAPKGPEAPWLPARPELGGASSAVALPRVLIIGPNVLNSRIGAGVTLSSAFGDWPTDHLAQIHTDTAEPDSGCASASYRLDSGAATGGSLLERQVRRQAALLAGDADVSMFGGRLRPCLQRWIEAFSPEAIFVQPSGLGIDRLTLAIQRWLGVPMVVHMSDDWMTGWPANTQGRRIFPVSDYLGWQARRTVRQLIDAATTLLAISEKMAVEYQHRYGRRFDLLYNAIDLARWPAAALKPVGKPATLLYSGSIFGYGQYQSLCDVRDAVVALRAEGYDVELRIHSQHADSAGHRADFDRPPACRLLPLVEKEALAGNLRSAEALVLPVNFDRATVDFLRFSMPGKLAEYLASGVPILCYGPFDMTQTEFLARHDGAEVLTRRDPAELRRAIRRLLEDEERRRDLGRRGPELAAQFFDLREQRERLKRVMRDATLSRPARAA